MWFVLYCISIFEGNPFRESNSSGSGERVVFPKKSRFGYV